MRQPLKQKACQPQTALEGGLVALLREVVSFLASLGGEALRSCHTVQAGAAKPSVRRPRAAVLEKAISALAEERGADHAGIVAQGGSDD